jgi:hypothetical protein
MRTTATSREEAAAKPDMVFTCLNCNKPSAVDNVQLRARTLASMRVLARMRSHPCTHRLT